MTSKLKYKKVGNNYELTHNHFFRGKVKPYENIHHEYFSIVGNGWVLIHKGYQWNGANFIPDTKHNLRASCLHDVYCQAMGKSERLLPMTFRPFSDITYRDICIEDGMLPFFANIQLLALRIYGVLRYGE